MESADRGADSVVRKQESPLAREAPVHPGREILQRRGVFGLVAGLLGHAPALVTDVVKSLHDGRPVVVPLKELNLELLEPAVFLDVQLEDALAQNRYPGFRRAVFKRIADVE